MQAIRTVAVIGAGVMGHSLAQVFAQGGYEVRLNDLREEILQQAKKLIASNLRTFIELRLLAKDEEAQILNRIRTTTHIEEAGEGADLVVEAIIEDAAAKKQLFKALDRICPKGAILASNTSYLDIFQFVETGRPEKILITHWFAPPHIVPLVEIVRGPQTSDETVRVVRELLIALGKRPIVISKFLPGFIANRLQGALRLEMLFLLDHGYATAEDIDEATKASFGLRIPILGLAKRMDFAGLDLAQKVLKNDVYEPPPRIRQSPTLDRLIAQGRLGVKSGKGFFDYSDRSIEEVMRERDIKLIRLREFLRELGELP
jgi:3-hydroxybutyryl-CoA dehydrogenase